MDDGFPVFPKKGDFVRFEKDWGYMNSQMSYASTQATAVFTTNQAIPIGSIGQILETHILDGYEHDVAEGYLLHIGLIINDWPLILKFPYTSRPDVLKVIPDTPAARALYGKSEK